LQEQPSNPELTPSEEKVMALAITARTYADCAQELGIKFKTFQAHLTQVFLKQKVSNLCELIIKKHNEKFTRESK